MNTGVNGTFCLKYLAVMALAGLLGCASAPVGQASLQQARSLWTPVDWAALPGFAQDGLEEAWAAWVTGCAKPTPVWAPLCPELRSLSLATADTQRQWMQKRLQPYQVQSLHGDVQGELTGYFEPVIAASRVPTETFNVPVYRPPVDLAQRKPWYSRKEIDTLGPAQAALRGRAIAYLANPVDAMVLQIQGSARLQITNPDRSMAWVRLSYAGSNDQPYRSVGRWLLDQGLVRDASWAGIKAWLVQNPERTQELIWNNPRVVFFKEELMQSADLHWGPRGAQGVALTPGRSIAVDPASIPLGTPVWMSSTGVQGTLQKLVMAQDTGSAISGAVRADYFVGAGVEAGISAGRLRQPLKLWALWPKQAGSR
jgi:membrane-bound lytic murein transglycosylase A